MVTRANVKRSVLSWLLVFALIVGMIPMIGVGVCADTISGTWGELTWSFEEETGTLIIEGQGQMNQFTSISSNDAWRSLKNQIKIVDIKNGVTSIGKNAFYSCENLKSVAISDSVTSIENNAFSGSKSLTNIELPKNITSIRDETFAGCSSLASIAIPNRVTSIGARVFEYCDSLTSITIPNSVSDIGAQAFYACHSITNITIPKNVTNISNAMVFGFCNSLSQINVDIKNSVYSSVDGVLFNNDQTQILCYPPGKSELLYCIPEGVSSIGEEAFFYCKNLKTITVPESVNNIGRFAFEGCSNLTSIMIPEGMIEIKARVFSGCSSLKKLIIPESVTSIGEWAFSGCSSLGGISIPESVTSVGEYAFVSCSSLNDGDVYYSGNETMWKSISFEKENEPLLSANIHYNSTYLDQLAAERAVFDAYRLEQEEYIDGLGNDDDSEECKQLILEAKSSFDAFEYDERKSIDENKEAFDKILEKLETDLNKQREVDIEVADIKAANRVEGQIDALPLADAVKLSDNTEIEKARKAYDELTDAQKVKVNADSLKKLEYVEAALKEAEEKEKADTETANKVRGHIDELPEIDLVKISDKAQIEAARKVYDELTNDQKAKIGDDTLKKLRYVEEALEAALNKEAADTEAADKVKEQIDVLPEVYSVKISDRAQIEAARKAYDELTDDQKVKISDDMLTKLKNMEDALKAAQEKDVADTEVANKVREQIESLPAAADVKIFDNTEIKATRKTYNELTEDQKVKISDDTLKKLEDVEGVLKDIQATYEISGTQGSLTWWFDEDTGLLMIEGKGEMKKSDYSNISWRSLNNKIKNVVIEDGITNIENEAFYNCSSLASITIPDSVMNIGYCAFENCSSLTSITIPNNVTSIDWAAFYNCSSLTSIAIPDSVTSIKYNTFSECSSLTSITIPDSITNIEKNSFRGCSLSYVEFEGNAPNIESSPFDADTVFYYHSGTTGWTTPTLNGYYTACMDPISDYSTLDEEDRNAQGVLFTLNESAKTAVAGDGSSSENNAGYHGAQRGVLVIPDVVRKAGVEYRVIGINQSAFRNNHYIDSVLIGKNITSIMPSAFYKTNITEFKVSEDNKYYSSIDGVLYDKEGLYLYVYPGGKMGETFSVPETVNTIGQYAFCNNANLSSLYVGENVTMIYQQAFCDLTGLTDITLPFIGTQKDLDDYYSNYYEKRLSSVFYNSSNEYMNPLPVNLAKVTILGGNLWESAFENCETIHEISYANVPESIPASCFSGCTNLKEIVLGDQNISDDSGADVSSKAVRYIGYEAFSDCKNLSKLVLGSQSLLTGSGQLILQEGVQSVNEGAFFNCKLITSVTIPATLTGMAGNAFNASSIEKFVVSDENTSYSTDDWGVLYNADKTVLVKYPQCRKWPYYNVASTATTIQNSAFSGCEQLINLYIPKTVTNLNYNAITGCPNTTICCYINSAAYQYVSNNNLTAWYMDNKKLQGISIYSLPEQKVQVEGQVDLQGLYVVGNYQGKELQIDDYTLSYDQKTSGVKTVTVEYQGKTVTFEMILYVSSEGNIISFHCDEELDGKIVMISVYDSNGKMLYTGEATIVDGTVQVGVSDSVYQNADHAKLFILDQKTFGPAMDCQEQMVQ